MVHNVNSEIVTVLASFESLTAKKPREHFCIHELYNLVKRLPTTSKREFLARLFWMLWIDQAVYSVLRPGSRRYLKFRREFPFPKVRSCPTFRQLPPAIVARALNAASRRQLLTRYRRKIWNPVSRWIVKTWSQRVLDEVLRSMREDLGGRVPGQLKYLLPQPAN